MLLLPLRQGSDSFLLFFFEGLFEELLVEVASCAEFIQVVDFSLGEEIDFEISVPPRKL